MPYLRQVMSASIPRGCGTSHAYPVYGSPRVEVGEGTGRSVLKFYLPHPIIAVPNQ
jgi:hypothetical protein